MGDVRICMKYNGSVALLAAGLAPPLTPAELPGTHPPPPRRSSFPLPSFPSTYTCISVSAELDIKTYFQHRVWNQRTNSGLICLAFVSIAVVEQGCVTRTTTHSLFETEPSFVICSNISAPATRRLLTIATLSETIISYTHSDHLKS